MKITVLMENTQGREDVCAEHGLSLWIETQGMKILMDTGASLRTWKNAEVLGIHPDEADYVILSHGHYDHTGGLLSLRLKDSAEVYVQSVADQAFYHGEKYIGMDSAVMNIRQLRVLKGDYSVNEHVHLFSGITGRRQWPSSNRSLTVHTKEGDAQDQFLHEQCLVMEENGKYMLFSGCAHNGILNILDRFRELYGHEPDFVFSGFHMKKKDGYTEDDVQNLKNTAEELNTMNTIFYTGHCTGEEAFGILEEIMQKRLRHLHAGDVIDTDSEEYFDVVDENGTPAGMIKARCLVHQDGDWHRTAHIWVINDKKEILLQRRAPDKDSFPNLLDISSAGHLSAGDDPLEGALREVREELGLSVNPEDLHHITSIHETCTMEHWKDREIADVYILRTNLSCDQMVFQKEEISEILYMKPEEFFRRTEEKDPEMLIHEGEIEILREYIATH